MSVSVILSLIGIVASYFMVKKRDAVADTIGEAEWMRKIGGVHLCVVYCAILLFFWSVAALTGTQDVFLAPIKLLLSPFIGGGGGQPQPDAGMGF